MTFTPPCSPSGQAEAGRSGPIPTQRTDPVYRSISLQTYLAENEHSVALSHQRAPATARGHQEMDGQAAGQAPLRVDSTAAAFGGARRTRPPSRDAGRAHRGRATWALHPRCQDMIRFSHTRTTMSHLVEDHARFESKGDAPGVHSRGL